jgi:hypothetical protein
MAATAEELSAQAAKLQQQTGYFRLGSEAAAVAAPAPAAPVPVAAPGRARKAAAPASRAKVPAAASRGFALEMGGAEPQALDDSHFERMSA